MKEREVVCVFFFFWVWAKRVGFVKWVLGLEDLAKKGVVGIWGC